MPSSCGDHAQPETRRLLPVAWFRGFDATVQSLTRLMGGARRARRELMELHGDAIEVDV